MEKVILAVGIIGAALSGAALDNTVVNDFWDTTGYVNGSTSASSFAESPFPS